MSTAYVDLDVDTVWNTKQEPPCETPGGGDLTSKQRKRELEVLRFKSPTAEGSPRSRGRNQKVHASGEIEVRRRAASVQERVQSPRIQVRGWQQAPRRRSTPPDGARAQQDAGRRVCQALALNAWRSQRSAAAQLQTDSTQLAAQLGGLRRQTATLRLLLDDEKLRVATAQQDAQRLTALLAEGLEDQAQLRTQLEQLDAQVKMADQRLARANEARANFHNDLLTANASWSALDGLVARSETQLARLRAEKVQLEHKLTERNEIICAQQAELRAMQSRSDALQADLTAQLKELRCAEKEVASERKDELEIQRVQLLAEAASMLAQREQLSALLNVQAQQIVRRGKDIEDLESELSSDADTERHLRTRIAQITARLSVTWYERVGSALGSLFWTWLRRRGQLV